MTPQEVQVRDIYERLADELVFLPENTPTEAREKASAVDDADRSRDHAVACCQEQSEKTNDSIGASCSEASQGDTPPRPKRGTWPPVKDIEFH